MRSEFVRKDFPGAVLLTEWMQGPDGLNRAAVVGKLSVLSDKELLGFEVNDRDSRWAVRVVGPSGFAVVIPGCKVRAVMAFPDTRKWVDNTDYWMLA